MEAVMTYCPLDQVESYLRRFVVYPSESALVVHVLWIAHTHLMDVWETTPRLGVMSPEKESGKTRLLEVTEPFVPNPFMGFSMSAASLVRVIGKGHDDHEIPTILFDEIDNVFCKSEEALGDLRAALNAGYRKGATAFRCVNSGASVQPYACFAPLAYAGIKVRKLPETLVSRTIFIQMRRAAPDEKKESFRQRYHLPEAAPIAAALAKWCSDIEDAIVGYEPHIPAGITDRAADYCEPLLAIADFADGDWPDRARSAVSILIGAAKDDSISGGVELLAHIKDAFLDAHSIHTDTLKARLCEREESPWNDAIKGGNPVNDRWLAEHLKPYGIKSKPVKISGLTLKGYQRADFEDAWKRYLPAPAQGGVTAGTGVTKLMNNNKKVTSVTPVTPKEAEYTGNELEIPDPDDLPEPGTFEPHDPVGRSRHTGRVGQEGEAMTFDKKKAPRA
jgi:hypothetical protein